MASLRIMFFAIAAWGQQPQKPAQPTLITHGACVDSSARSLGVFIGDYDVDASFRSGSGAWDSSSAHSQFIWVLGGCIMRENFVGRSFNRPYEYLALWGTSGPGSHRVQRLFVHSQHGLLGISEGDWNAARDSLIVEDSVLVRGQWIRQRNVMTRPVAGRFTVEGWRSEDGGKTWFPTNKARYSRRRGR